MHTAAVASTRIVLLPGMDGTSALLVDTFARHLCNSGPGGSDPSRVVLVDYPRHRCLSCSQLAEHVMETYLRPLSSDERGYVIVAQSFSGHVALHLLNNCCGNPSGKLPGVYKGTVFVNGFCSLPMSWAKPIIRALPQSIFARQPPAWLAARFFFGRDGSVSQMKAVQDVVSPVAPFVMKARLLAVANENSWHLWRDQSVLPECTALFLYGSGDVLVGATDHIKLLQESRMDVDFVGVEGGAHLLLQTKGAACASLIDDFASTRQK